MKTSTRGADVTPAQMETMVREAFLRIFGAECVQAYSMRLDDGTCTAAATNRGSMSVSIMRDHNMRCVADVVGPHFDVAKVHRSSSSAALRYAEAAYMKGAPSNPYTRA